MIKRTLTRTVILLSIASLVAASWAMTAGLSTVHAATIVVTTTEDEFGKTSDCSLREAIYAANTGNYFSGCPAEHGANRINLPAGTYTLSIIDALQEVDENLAETGDLDILSSLTIVGEGASSTIVTKSAELDNRIFDINPSGKNAITVTIQGLTIQGGTALTTDGGGGLRNTLATLHLTGVTFAKNIAGSSTVSVVGGGVRNRKNATLTVANCVFTGNLASGNGGAIFNEGSLTITSSQFTAKGQGITSKSVLDSRGPTTITGSTFISNASTDPNAVVVKIAGSLKLEHSAITDNTGTGLQINASGEDAASIYTSTIANNTNKGIYRFSGKAEIAYTTISGNGSSDPNGGIVVESADSAKIINSTISGNSGPGINNVGSLTLSSTTIVDNTGTGLLLRAGSVSSVTMQSTLLARHSGGYNCILEPAKPDVPAASFQTLGYNLLDNQASPNPCPFDFGPDRDIVGNPMLASQLADNGGPTETYAITSPDSDAVDRVPQGSAACVALDQRLYGRPGQGSTSRPAGCDIGAFELNGRIERYYMPFIRK